MRQVRSVSVGVWIRTALAAKNRRKNGLAHSWRLVFKGTERRSAEYIAREMDSSAAARRLNFERPQSASTQQVSTTPPDRVDIISDCAPSSF